MSDDRECARKWASSSARTLARRLRRHRRDERGNSRASALAHRVATFRTALAKHWELTDMLGAHYSQCSEAVGAARMLNLKDVDVNEFEEVHTAANWARHAPPPGAVRMPLGPRFGVMAAELESFRYFLFAAAAEVPQAAAEEEETPKCPVEPHLASSVLENRRWFGGRPGAGWGRGGQ